MPPCRITTVGCFSGKEGPGVCMPPCRTTTVRLGTGCLGRHLDFATPVYVTWWHVRIRHLCAWNTPVCIWHPCVRTPVTPARIWHPCVHVTHVCIDDTPLHVTRRHPNMHVTPLRMYPREKRPECVWHPRVCTPVIILCACDTRVYVPQW